MNIDCVSCVLRVDTQCWLCVVCVRVDSGIEWPRLTAVHVLRVMKRCWVPHSSSREWWCWIWLSCRTVSSGCCHKPIPTTSRLSSTGLTSKWRSSRSSAAAYHKVCELHNRVPPCPLKSLKCLNLTLPNSRPLKVLKTDNGAWKCLKVLHLNLAVGFWNFFGSWVGSGFTNDQLESCY